MTMPVKVKPENVVNAYLFYSQRLLNLTSSATLIGHKADKMAITAAVCLSLKQAWQAWLEELSVYVGCTIPDYSFIFIPENNRHPEIVYLLDISKQPDSWLTQLIIFFEPRLNEMSPSSAVNDDQSSESEGLAKKINLVAVDSDKTYSDEERLINVVNSFKSYVNVVRARQAEW